VGLTFLGWHTVATTISYFTMEVQLNHYFIPAVVGVDDTLFPLVLSLSFKVVDFDRFVAVFPCGDRAKGICNMV